MFLKRVESSHENSCSYTEKYQDISFISFAKKKKKKKKKYVYISVLLIKLHVLIINSVKRLFFTEKKMLLTDLLKQFLMSMIIVKK